MICCRGPGDGCCPYLLFKNVWIFLVLEASLLEDEDSNRKAIAKSNQNISQSILRCFPSSNRMPLWAGLLLRSAMRRLLETRGKPPKIISTLAHIAAFIYFFDFVRLCDIAGWPSQVASCIMRTLYRLSPLMMTNAMKTGLVSG